MWTVSSKLRWYHGLCFQFALSPLRLGAFFCCGQNRTRRRRHERDFAKKQTLFKRGFSLVAGLLRLGCGLTLGVQKGSVVICLLLCCFGVALCGWSVLFYTISAWGAGRSMPKIRSSADFRFERDAVVVNQGQ